MSTGEVFSCPFDGWLDNGPGAIAAGSRTVSCTISGNFVTCAKQLRDKERSNQNMSNYGQRKAFLYLYTAERRDILGYTSPTTKRSAHPPLPFDTLVTGMP